MKGCMGCSDSKRGNGGKEGYDTPKKTGKKKAKKKAKK